LESAVISSWTSTAQLAEQFAGLLESFLHELRPKKARIIINERNLIMVKIILVKNK
jgi:hypothetical protein